MSKKLIKILYFGRLAEITNKNEEMLEVASDQTVKELLLSIAQNYKGLEKHSFKIAVNQKIVKLEESLANATEIALLPPFSGG